ncbi:hypothetical protein QE422_001325 [Chryseobacterium sp. SORGH_AS 447]|uniref:hypothetical protein n=1 Tax=Chryseobacterium sp. SORGH_AS_0447 TaxID=3041769 RepID=UPI002780A59A|nr:hypothetical protein [Chryseobacterium sp. SORGH_AS_0447]MDQ1160957.1 hypothetical protein [Chryseobacterium sp. SORGH_AS_0447]
MYNIQNLYETLNERKRPEDVAEIIAGIIQDKLTTAENEVLEKAAQGALNRSFFGYTSMLESFGEVIGADRQINKALKIFRVQNLSDSDYSKTEGIEQFLYDISPLISKPVGQNNFKTDRLNKTERKEVGLDISKRSYNKKWRLLKRIEKRLQKFIIESKKLEFQKISKHGLSHTINFGDFSADINTACFIAYYNARCNVRSAFTNHSQERPFDEICEMLFNRCRSNEANTNWWAVSHIYASDETLSHLTEEQKGILLGKWTSIIQEIAEFMSDLWKNNDINRKTMAVKKGNDSSTWNNTAGAWNKARDSWMNLVYSLGMEVILDDLCFGKVMRLMAADVVAWHYATGGKIDPDTEVWNKLPLPWEVFEGKAFCNKKLIADICKEVRIDPEKSGWIAPRTHTIAKYKPTPELVHGVMVSNPFMATILKKNKFFSGKINK